MVIAMSETQSVRTPSWMTLDPDERVLLRMRPSTNLVMAAVVLGFFLITLGATPFIALGAVDVGRRTTFAITGLVVVAVLALFLFVRHREYAVTNKRVSVATGLRSKEVRSVSIADITDVALNQGRADRILSIGTLRFATDGDAENLSFNYVGSPHYVYERALDFTQNGTATAGKRSLSGSPT